MMPTVFYLNPYTIHSSLATTENKLASSKYALKYTYPLRFLSLIIIIVAVKSHEKHMGLPVAFRNCTPSEDESDVFLGFLLRFTTRRGNGGRPLFEPKGSISS